MRARPPIIWAVSDGRAGIERQAIALANAIIDNGGGVLRVVRLAPKGPQTLLPPNMWPDPLGALPSEQQTVLKSEMPDIWIANGRRTIAYSLWVKKHFPDVLTVQLQNPKISSNNFDFVVAPKHDQVKGDNVFETLGGLVYYSNGEISRANATFPMMANSPQEKCLVILGGNSKTHKFTMSKANQILEHLRLIVHEDISAWITTSRRTPPEIANLFRNFVKEHAKFGCLFFENEKIDGENPYLAWLTNAHYALVTEDSSNMLADAAFFSLPITLLRLDGGSRKFDRLHKSFVDGGAARWLNGNPEHWEYHRPNNVKKIANAIVTKWQTGQI